MLAAAGAQETRKHIKAAPVSSFLLLSMVIKHKLTDLNVCILPLNDCRHYTISITKAKAGFNLKTL